MQFSAGGVQWRLFARCRLRENGRHMTTFLTTFLLTTAIIMLALGLLSYVSRKRYRSDEASAVSLLPGDIKYESPSGNFVFHFPS
jgi:Protein of unknown function (DUF2905)